MKQNDIAMILIVVFVSAVLGLVLSNKFIDSGSNRNKTTLVVDPIKSDFNVPGQKYFNEQSVDPTQIIRIGDSTNDKPFKSDQQ